MVDGTRALITIVVLALVIGGTVTRILCDMDTIKKYEKKCKDNDDEISDLKKAVKSLTPEYKRCAYYEVVRIVERGVFIATYDIELHTFRKVTIEGYSYDMKYALCRYHNELQRIPLEKIRLLENENQPLPKDYEKEWSGD